MAIRKLPTRLSGILPAGVKLFNANKTFFDQTVEGLVVRSNDAVTQVNTAGGFNGSGLGNAGYISLSALDGMSINNFQSLTLEARTDDAGTDIYFGQVSVNLLANFANASLPTATDFVNLVLDGSPTSSYGFFPLTTAFATATVTNTQNVVRAVNGTGSITFTGTVSSGSTTITSVSAINAMTVGMFVKESPTAFSLTPDSGKAFPEGTTIVSINVGASSMEVSNPSARSGVAASLLQWGGIAPVSRSGTLTSGSATITGITNTADLQVNMKVTGTGIQANSRIISMVANTSITLSATATATGADTLSFVASGLTGIPSNVDLYIGVSMSRIYANNPNAVFSKTTPITPTWTTTDGGWGKNFEYNAVNFKIGGSGTTSRAPKRSTFKAIHLNGVKYRFGKD